MDPEIGIAELSTMSGVVTDSLWRERFSVVLVGVNAGLAVLIASCGLYAVVSRSVERRTHELGIRLALGATGLRIAQAVLGHGLRVTGMGIVVGILLTMTTGRLLPQQAYQPNDLPWLLAAVTSLLLILTLLACWLPVRRALAVGSITTLRCE